MIYDCFMFFNELDLLEIRLNEFKDVDCKHILIESTLTHQGLPKPMCFEENKDRFKAFKDKIIYLRYSQPMWMNISCVIRESSQRDYGITALDKCEPDDIVIISDADEIISKKAIEFYNPEKGSVHAALRMSYYYVNCVSPSDWLSAIITPYKELRYRSMNATRWGIYHNVINNAGWHFSYIGGVEGIQKKLSSFCHDEYNTPEFTSKTNIENRIKNGEDLFGRGIKYVVEPLDGSYPKYLLDNQDRFKHLIAEVK